jgi:type IV pilus assembly protein PilQ
MKNLLLFIILIAALTLSAQTTDRNESIKNQLELLAIENTELNENLKLEFNVNNVSLPNFLLAISRVHGLNMSISTDIPNITLVNNFNNVTVSDLLVYLCKEYNLDIEFTGNILSIKKYTQPIELPTEKVIQVAYNNNDLISVDLQNDPLGNVFRKIMDLSGNNLLFSNGLESKPLNIYLSNVPFEMAMEKLAATNGLTYTKSKDGFYLFDSFDGMSSGSDNAKQRLVFNNLGYQVVDTLRRNLDVDFKNTPIASLINGLKQDLKLNIYTASPLNEAGNVTFNAKNITFDELLHHIFTGQVTQVTKGSQPTSNISNRNSRPSDIQPPPSNPNNFTFKKQDDIYFFGTADQLSLRKVEVIQLMHRSVELLGNPSQVRGSRSSGRTNEGSVNFFGDNGNSNSQQNSYGNQRSINTQPNSFSEYQNGAEAIVSIIPDEIKVDLDIKVDYELNSFLVSGPASNINRFKKFIKEIDKPVPVVLIEVMIIEVKKSATVETGISWGIGDTPVTTNGKLFPTTDVTLGANTVNKIIGGFDGFGSFNMGKVIPEFFANIKAMEANGNLKIRSSPKLSTLNGHRANLSIGETTYYVVTNQNFFGSQIPTTSQVRNYLPIDAELAIGIKPLVSGDGQVTLDINVVQSDFSGERIEDDAPPGLTSREFSSIIRMQNQDLAILGGLEEKVKNDSGNGVPFLARIPVIKWLFSQRKREDTKQKLTILIKPTVIY